MIFEKKAVFSIESMMKSVENMGIDKSPKELIEIYSDIVSMQQLYNAAIREISTKLEILDDEFNIKYAHSPVHHIESRLKLPRSIMEKLSRKNLDIDMKSATEHLTDIAGIRVVCHYIDDVYTIMDLITGQDDVTLIRKIDYIKEPKANGYRSLHIVVLVPVFLSNSTERVPVEIQIRTIAMDFWASLEHELRYKSTVHLDESLMSQLYECAEGIAAIDNNMQEIHRKIY